MSEQSNERGEQDRSLEGQDIAEGEVVEDTEGETNEQLTLRTQSLQYRGPVPPPEWMEHYERIVPGSAKQMMDDVHDQSAHRRQIEREESQTEITLAKRGQLFGFTTACAGFVVVMTGMVGGLYLAYAGVSLGGGIALVLLSLAAIAAVFVANRFAASPPRQNAPPDDPVTVRREPPTPNGS